MADIEIVIKLDKELFEQEIYSNVDLIQIIAPAVHKGTPLDKHDAEVIKETVESIWGKPCDDAISRADALVSIKNLYPDMPIVNIMGARQKWLEKYAPYFECENAIEQLSPVNPQNNVLDKIKTEIGQYQVNCDLACSDGSNCRTCNNITFGSIYRIINKYRKGKE